MTNLALLEAIIFLTAKAARIIWHLTLLVCILKRSSWFYDYTENANQSAL